MVHGVLAPRYLRWGATDEETARPFPGDEWCRPAGTRATRAVTIHAPAHEVWPWLVQIGQDRGGFYSYSWLEDLFGARIHNADRIVAEFQHREVGDTVWLGPPDRYGGKAAQAVAALEPGRSMTLMGPPDWQRVQGGESARLGAWTFVVDPIDERSCRLLVRSRGHPPNPAFDLVHFIMERRMMLGIKERAERAS